MRAYVGEIELIIDESGLPAITKALSDLAQSGSIKGGKSTTMKVVYNGNAALVFGGIGANEVRKVTEVKMRIGNQQYKVRPVTYGTEYIECTALSGNSSWFDYAKNTRLNDLDLGKTSYVVSAAEMRDSWTRYEDFIMWPVVNYGLLSGRSENYDLALNKMRPGVRIGNILSRAFELEGWTVEPKGRLANMWSRFVQLFDTQNLLTGYDDTGAYRATVEFDDTISHLSQPPFIGSNLEALNYLGQIGLDVVVSDPDNRYAAAPDYRYTCGNETDVVINALYMYGSPGTSGKNVHLVVYDYTDQKIIDWHTRQLTSESSVNVMNWSDQFIGLQTTPGNEIGLCLMADSDWPSGGDIATPYAEVYFHSRRVPFEYDTDLDVASVIGNKEWTVQKALMSLVQSKCLVVNTRDEANIIELWLHDEYYRQPNPAQPARDWSSRSIDENADKVKVEDLPATLEFTYQEDGKDLEIERLNQIMPEGVGFGGERLLLGGVGKGDKVANPACATAMGVTMDGRMKLPFIRQETDVANTDHEYEIKPRLLYDGGLLDCDWLIDGLTLTQYPHVYFTSDLPGDPPLHYGNINRRKIEFGGLVEGVLSDDWSLRIEMLRSRERFTKQMLVSRDELTSFDFGQPTKVRTIGGSVNTWVESINNQRNGRALVTLNAIPRIILESPIDRDAIRWPGRLVEVDYIDLGENKSGNSGATNGTRIFIFDNGTTFGSAGSLDWRANVGAVATKTASGWDYEPLAVGDIVYSPDTSTNGYSAYLDHYLILVKSTRAEYNDYGRGVVGVRYLSEMISQGGNTYILRHNPLYVGSYDTERNDIIDEARWFQVEVNIPGDGWTLLETGYLNEVDKYASTFVMPPDCAQYTYRLKWFRGNHFQGLG